MNEILAQLAVLLGMLSTSLTPTLGVADCKADVTRSVSERIEVCPISGKDKANFKAQEIVKHNLKGTFTRDGLTIEITDYRTMDGGIEVFARAWKNGQQLGFGDGTVDIERFRIFNPPVKVSDGTTRMETVPFGSKTKEIEVKNLKEDPAEAIRQTLAHTISLVGKDSSNVVLGKIGNTTSTFYPDANPESTSVDGYTNFTSGLWSEARNSATAEIASDTATGEWLMADLESTIYTVARHFYLFDTSGLPDADSITAAIFSAYQSNAGEGDPNVGLIQTSPASNTAISTADHDALTLNSPTEGSARVGTSAATLDTYRDFTLNASGLSWITATGITKLGLRVDYDIDNTTPTARRYTRFDFVDQTGSSKDPKLVITHAAASDLKPNIIFFNFD